MQLKRFSLFFGLLLLLAPCALRAQVGPGVVPWLSSTPPTFCPGATPLYAIGIGFTGQGTVYGNSGTGTGCAVVGGGGTGGGTVTSVGLTMPGLLFNSSVPGSPVTSAGTLAPTLATQSANTVLAGPSSGSAVTPTFRQLTATDLANLWPFSSTLPASFWGVGDSTAAAQAFVQNQTVLFTFTLGVPVTVNYIQTYVNTADNTSTNNYDIGIIAQSGTVLFHTGAVHGSAFGAANNNPSLAVTSPGILYPGTYAFAYTTNCASSCLVLQNSITVPFGFSSNSGGATSGGVLTNISAFGGYNGGHWSSSFPAYILHQ